jgi:hypothetical protein
MPPLSPAERNRLVAILGRLGSDYDGERASAGLLASRLLRDRGLCWDDLILASAGVRQASGGTQSGHSAWPPGHDNLVLCLRWLGELSPWEVGFITDLRRKRRPLTPAQAAKLAQIADALRARGLT